MSILRHLAMLFFTCAHKILEKIKVYSQKKSIMQSFEWSIFIYKSCYSKANKSGFVKRSITTNQFKHVISCSLPSFGQILIDSISCHPHAEGMRLSPYNRLYSYT